MSDLQEIESAVIALLRGMESAGEPTLETVRGIAAADRRAALSAISWLAKPAALVIVEGRVRVSAVEGRPGDPRVLVLVAGASLRSGDDARLGGSGGPGAYPLAGQVTRVLDGAIVEGGWRLSAVDEKVVAADERLVVVEQRWIAEQPAELIPPNYGRMSILGSGAVVGVEVGIRRIASVDFAFPGVDGVFRHVLGTAGRVIRWTGRLRATSHADLTTIENGIEALVGDGTPRTMFDSLGRFFENCVVESYDRRGPRRIHPLSHDVMQSFELQFLQVTG